MAYSYTPSNLLNGTPATFGDPHQDEPGTELGLPHVIYADIINHLQEEMVKVEQAIARDRVNYSIEEFGVEPGDYIDDALVSALAVVAPKKGRVYLPPVSGATPWRLQNPNINVPAESGVVGIHDPWPGVMDINNKRGSLLYIEGGHGVSTGHQFNMGPMSRFGGVILYYPNQGQGSTPTAYPMTFKVDVPDVQISSLMAVNPYWLIGQTNRQTAPDPYAINPGRMIVEKVWGQPLCVGIMNDGSLDVSRITDVHFWPFWRWTHGSQGSQTIEDWQWQNAVALMLGRSDSFMVDRFFAYGYEKGVQFYGYDRNGEKQYAYGTITNSSLDACRLPIAVEGVDMGTLPQGIIVDNTLLCCVQPSWVGNQYPVQVSNSPRIALTIHKCPTWSNGFAISALDVDASSGGAIDFSFNRIRDWNNRSTSPGFAAVRAAGNTRLTMIGNDFHENFGYHVNLTGNTSNKAQRIIGNDTGTGSISILNPNNLTILGQNTNG